MQMVTLFKTCVIAVALAGVAMVFGGRVADAGERAFSFSMAPGRGDYIAVNLNSYHLGKYLAEMQLNRPEILHEVKATIERGEYYRKKTVDQKGIPVRITASVNPEYMLRLVTWRNDTCAECKGTGRATLPFAEKVKGVALTRKCHVCKGNGYIENNTTEKYFMLSSEDFEHPEEGRRIMKQRSFANAPSGAEEWIEQLVSDKPEKRLEACEWLDKNYVRIGGEFQDIMPMLRKARYQESNDKRRIAVWQFWAGKDLPSERKRAFYRIYVNTKNGKVTEKGFFAAR